MTTQNTKPFTFVDAVRFSPVDTKNELQHYLLNNLQATQSDLQDIDLAYSNTTIRLGDYKFPITGLILRAFEELRAKGANEPEYRAWTQQGALSKRHAGKIEAGIAAEEAAKRFITLAASLQDWLNKNVPEMVSTRPTPVGVECLISYDQPRMVKVNLTKRAGEIASELKLQFQTVYDSDVDEATIVTFKSE